jgi:hypothetical protein
MGQNLRLAVERVGYNFAIGIELSVNEGAPLDLRRHAWFESEALDLICQRLHAREARE